MSAQWQEGYAAARDNLPETTCPYNRYHGSKRTQWIEGYRRGQKDFHREQQP